MTRPDRTGNKGQSMNLDPVMCTPKAFALSHVSLGPYLPASYQRCSVSRVLSSGWQRPGNGANEGRPLTAGRMAHWAHGSAVLLEFVWPATRQAWERICSWGGELRNSL